MNFATLEAAMIAWVAALTGIDPLLVTFEDMPRPQSNGTRALLSWVSDVPRGRDEIRWEEDPDVLSGAAASFVAGAAAGFVRITGLTGMSAGAVGRWLTFSGAAVVNNGTVPIAVFNDATSVDVTQATSVTPDPNNGAIGWILQPQNLTPVQVGNRVMSLQVACETFSQAPDAPHARALCETMRGRVRRPSSLAALDAVNVGLNSVSATTQANYTADGRIVARALFEVSLNVTSFDRDVDGSVGSIEHAKVSSHLVDPSGAELPAGEQITNEVMP